MPLFILHLRRPRWSANQLYNNKTLLNLIDREAFFHCLFVNEFHHALDGAAVISMPNKTMPVSHTKSDTKHVVKGKMFKLTPPAASSSSMVSMASAPAPTAGRGAPGPPAPPLVARMPSKKP